MKKFILNLIEKIGIEIIALAIFLFLFAGGLVYATWDQAKTNGNSNPNQVDENNWNSLIEQVQTKCAPGCNLEANNAGYSVCGGNPCITQDDWNSLVDLFSEALSDSNCACQHIPCSSGWTGAQSAGNFTKTNWNNLVDLVYGKCSGATCLNSANTAKITNSKLTFEDWNGLVDLANTTITNCVSGCAENCSTGPGCRASLANGHTVSGTCCSGNCYDCDTSYTWDGLACVPSCSNHAFSANNRGDTRLAKQSPNTNDGGNQSLVTQAMTGGPWQRSVISFDVSSGAGYTAGASAITSATLSLYHWLDFGDSSTGRIIRVYALKNGVSSYRNFAENQATWNRWRTSDLWTTAGGDYVPINPPFAEATMPTAPNWMDWDITEIVKDAVTNNSGIVNLIIKDNFEAPASGNFTPLWYSRDTVNTALRPKLEIDYQTCP